MLFTVTLVGCSPQPTTVEVTGYIAINSPYDGSYAYITSLPMSYADPADPSVYVVYPAQGTAVRYTEKCVKVKAEFDGSHHYVNMSYEPTAPNSLVGAYNSAIDAGHVQILDEWISMIMYYTQEHVDEDGNPVEIEKQAVDGATYEMRLIESLIPKDVISAVAGYSTAYNNWLEAFAKDDSTLTDAYDKVQEATDAWFKSLEVSPGG